MGPLPEPIASYLTRQVAADRPDRLMVIADPACPTRAYAEAAGENCRFDTLSPARALANLDRLERCALAIAIDLTATLARPAASQLLGRLRDVVAGSLLVVAATGCGAAGNRVGSWTRADAIALGLTRAQGSARLDPDYAIYRYSIYDYKITPSWLNARHWANPERWDKQRW